MKYSKETIMLFYVFLVLVLGALGYYFGDVKYMAAGALAGVVLSVILWFTVGKKMVTDGGY